MPPPTYQARGLVSSLYNLYDQLRGGPQKRFQGLTAPGHTLSPQELEYAKRLAVVDPRRANAWILQAMSPGAQATKQAFPQMGGVLAAPNASHAAQQAASRRASTPNQMVRHASGQTSAHNPFTSQQVGPRIGQPAPPPLHALSPGTELRDHTGRLIAKAAYPPAPPPSPAQLRPRIVGQNEVLMDDQGNIIGRGPTSAAARSRKAIVRDKTKDLYVENKDGGWDLVAAGERAAADHTGIGQVVDKTTGDTTYVDLRDPENIQPLRTVKSGALRLHNLPPHHTLLDVTNAARAAARAGQTQAPPARKPELFQSGAPQPGTAPPQGGPPQPRRFAPGVSVLAEGQSAQKPSHVVIRDLGESLAAIDLDSQEIVKTFPKDPQRDIVPFRDPDGTLNFWAVPKKSAPGAEPQLMMAIPPEKSPAEVERERTTAQAEAKAQVKTKAEDEAKLKAGRDSLAQEGPRLRNLAAGLGALMTHPGIAEVSGNIGIFDRLMHMANLLPLTYDQPAEDYLASAEKAAAGGLVQVLERLGGILRPLSDSDRGVLERMVGNLVNPQTSIALKQRNMMHALHVAVQHALQTAKPLRERYGDAAIMTPELKSLEALTRTTLGKHLANGQWGEARREWLTHTQQYTSLLTGGGSTTAGGAAGGDLSQLSTEELEQRL